MLLLSLFLLFFFFNDTATTEIYTLSLHDALPISGHSSAAIAPVLATASEASIRPARPACAPALPDSAPSPKSVASAHSTAHAVPPSDLRTRPPRRPAELSLLPPCRLAAASSTSWFALAHSPSYPPLES